MKQIRLSGTMKSHAINKDDVHEDTSEEKKKKEDHIDID